MTDIIRCNIKYVEIRSECRGSCEECHKSVYQSTDCDYLSKMINHYLSHGYEVKHVGQETSRDDDGNPWQSTVAILLKP